MEMPFIFSAANMTDLFELKYFIKNCTMLIRLISTLYVAFGTFLCGMAQPALTVPKVYSNIKTENGQVYLEYQGQKVFAQEQAPKYTLELLIGSPVGTDNGLEFSFDLGLNGKLYYGFIPYGDTDYPHPVYFRAPVNIKEGKASVPIKSMAGTYDMVGWERQEKGTLGYRVTDHTGQMLYDGIVSFKGKGPFEVIPTIIEGPFVNLLTPDGATISFTTNRVVQASVVAGGKTFADPVATKYHEIALTGLSAATEYPYTVRYGEMELSFSFRTAPRPGSRKPFSFTYASDSRAGQGGGERNVWGSNNYIMKKIMALGRLKQSAFMQFTGDLINGYLVNPDNMRLQYANWKRGVQPFTHYAPVVAAMGNHEALMRKFMYKSPDGKDSVSFQVNRFPFETESAEAIFTENFVNPINGPDSEDGAAYDPDPKQTDFPSYKENVFYYTYDNVAVVVMNSNYFYAPTTTRIPHTGGGLHGYIMDQQLKWLENTIAMLEKDKTIDHIFTTQHTPCFPNGGHVRDDMWYGGNNTPRPYVAGKALDKGIIERRDQILDIIVNKSTKVRAILTGDEHNYNRLRLTPETLIYPENYDKPKIKLSRTIYQINNGAAGAPYYAQEQTPWTPYVSGFTTQHALVFFHVHKKKIAVEVVNPDTLEEVDRFQLH